MKITSRDKRIIIIGVIAVVAVSIYYAATSLIPDGESLSRQVEVKKRMLRSQRETLTRQNSYKLRLEQSRKQFEQDKTRFLTGTEATLAGADLQKVIRNYADQASLELNPSNILQEMKIQDLATKISVSINAPAPNSTCMPDQLVQLISLIENYEKLLIIEDLTINSRSGFAVRGMPRRNEINFTMTVSGFITPKEEKPKEKTEAKPGSASVS